MGIKEQKEVVGLQEILRKGYIGNPAQLVTLRRVEVKEGRAQGTQIIEVRTADGLVYTCGLCSAGPTNRDGDEWHPLHGRYHSLQAEQGQR